MTIELNRKDSKYTYRINPWSPLVIDRRRNQANARWLFYARRANEKDAIAYLLELEREQKETQAK